MGAMLVSMSCAIISYDFLDSMISLSAVFHIFADCLMNDAVNLKGYGSGVGLEESELWNGDGGEVGFSWV